MKNIVLVGFMGTGKSTVGKAIADALNIQLINTDDLIEKKTGAAISDIFEEKGEVYFRGAEREVVKEVSLQQDSVIDAGGGVVINEENMKDLKRNGIIFCLNAAPEEILDRTERYTHRPLLNVADPIAQIRNLLELRKEYYENADYQIETSGKSVSQVSQEIIEIYEEVTN